MEDALISPMGFAILSGAGLVEASSTKKINVHKTSQLEVKITAAGSNFGTERAATDQIIADLTEVIGKNATLTEKASAYGFIMTDSGSIGTKLGVGKVATSTKTITFTIPTGSTLKAGDTVVVMVDYYVEMSGGVTQLEVTPDKFAGNYYLEASTLFRRQEDGVDLPAEFVIPNVKIQSAFNFSMAASGDPSTFAFTMDAFPDYTKFDRTKKVLFALQIVEDVE
ncbi:hypothetical protein [Clostridium sp.]|uniref:hypothetical protein n=1 Tax=Clostridium sp. TaxID=1506 RepID=UPI002FC7362E